MIIYITEIVDKAEKIEEDDNITAKDLGDIEKAIEDQARHYKDELAEVAEDLDEYKEVNYLLSVSVSIATVIRTSITNI